MSTHSDVPGIGLLYRAADIGMPVLDLAKAAEERGFGALLVGEHTHIPVARRTPYPGGGDLPPEYPRFLDPFVALSFVAAQTSLIVGTGVSLIAQHDPIALAKCIATLDHLSQGRFVLGIGFGWNKDELDSHGQKFSQRRAIVREYVQLMRSLWQDEEAEFSGVHATLEPSWSWPKPVQLPIPVLLGGQATEKNIDDITRFYDGWIPGGWDPAGLEAGLTELRRRWTEVGRAGSGPITWVMQMVGDDAGVAFNLARFQEMSIEKVMFDIPTGDADSVLPLLDRMAAIVASVYS